MEAGGAPDPERLARYKEEWLRLLQEALPPLEPPAAEAAAPGSASARGEAGSPGASASGARDAASPSQDGGSPGAERWPPEGGGASGASSFLESLGLERLFGDARPCRQDEGAVQASERGREQAIAFKVQVPKQYPGVQYRKSKNLNDRYPRYAKLGTVVTGVVEDDGEWLRISDQVFLPMKVGGIQILEPSLQDPTTDAREGTSKSIKSLWFACSQGNHGEEQEVVTDLKETN